MAYLASHFTDSPVFIYDEKNNLIAKTTVSGYDRDEMYIEVAKGLGNIRLKTRLHLLIIHSGGVSELSGFLKSTRQGLHEISIYGEQQREGRASERRLLKSSAQITDMVTDTSRDGLLSPFPVMIENISATGVLLESVNVRFEMGAFLQIEFSIGGKDVVLYGEIVREHIIDGGVFEYGCKLHFLD